jgi:hypothetical protein
MRYWLLMRNVIIRCCAIWTALAVLGTLVVGGFGVFEDDVPSVDEAGEATETE